MTSVPSWRKLGLVFCPSGQRDWLKSHASVPIAEHIGGDLFKIYFSSRDAANRSFTGYIVMDINRPRDVINISPDPVLAPGDLGEFDDSGAMASWLTTYKGRKFLYYIGWNLGVTVPFRNSIGVAVDQPDGSFRRLFPGPVVDRTMHEPHFCASCCVLPGDDCWRMWYLSCTGWRLRNGKPEHCYHIKYAESDDGLTWRRDRAVAIDYSDDQEYAISRPSVMKDSDCWRMWYSYRGERYRIGYAESQDGKRWRRMDQHAGIDVSDEGWDSEMIQYPFVFDHKGQRYMLYNGNDYGRTGFGIAVMEKA
jgi:predicted GH43/DUF377 family glycosyl hydrolase